ncbi:MAG TPA: O-antigen ligase domain-containing protein [Deltaproteobacteria bacterium]|nr:O-antigen ligase domain-containing protein [Deltaproteobacteria bacterium]HQI80515.1 O-antigen ligase domain-containing protein [Deltaproteobacteria bacterium]
MNPIVHIVMFGWIPVVIGLFSVLKPRHAVITSFLVAWLFLPNAAYPLPGLPDYTKISATCWGIFIAAALFDMENLARFRFRTLDVPMLVWCLCPVASSLANGYGLYDGLAVSLRQTVTWGFPYFIGRVYFNSLEALKELAVGIFIGGMVYVPLSLWESRMSPQLHYNLYGFYQHSFAQTYRWGGWRPMVFLSHGLMLGVWMMSASVVGVWLWATGALKDIRGLSMVWMVPVLVLTSIWCKSTAAIAYLFGGVAILFLSRRIRKPLFIILLLAIPLLYLPVRATGMWDGGEVVSFIAEHVSEERAESLQFRLDNEDILADRALQNPLFGWATWGKARVYDEEGRDISVTDGLWIIAFGNHGLVGLVSMTLAVLMPVFFFVRSYPASSWGDPRVASAAALSLLLAIYMVDNLLNAMVNPIFIVTAGGISGLPVLQAALKRSEAVRERVVPGEAAYAPRFI